jgi:hypothetical protein
VELHGNAHVTAEVFTAEIFAKKFLAFGAVFMVPSWPDTVFR